MHIQEQVVSINEGELDSRVELTEAGMRMLQLARIEEAFRKANTWRAGLAYDAIADGWTLEVVYVVRGEPEGRCEHFRVHGTDILDVFAQAAQVLEVT